MQTTEWTSDRVQFKHLVEAVGLLGWIADAAGYCHYVSPSWCEFTGLSPDEAVGAGWLRPIHPADRTRMRRLYLEASGRGAELHLGCRLERANAEYVPCWAYGRATFADGKFSGYLGVTNAIARHAPTTASDGKYALTERERQVLALIARGNTTNTIAAMLRVSARTVDGHTMHAAHKLGAANREQLPAPGEWQPPKLRYGHR